VAFAGWRVPLWPASDVIAHLRAISANSTRSHLGLGVVRVVGGATFKPLVVDRRGSPVPYESDVAWDWTGQSGKEPMMAQGMARGRNRTTAYPRPRFGAPASDFFGNLSTVVDTRVVWDGPGRLTSASVPWLSAPCDARQYCVEPSDCTLRGKMTTYLRRTVAFQKGFGPFDPQRFLEEVPPAYDDIRNGATWQPHGAQRAYLDGPTPPPSCRPRAWNARTVAVHIVTVLRLRQATALRRLELAMTGVDWDAFAAVRVRDPKIHEGRYLLAMPKLRAAVFLPNRDADLQVLNDTVFHLRAFKVSAREPYQHLHSFYAMQLRRMYEARCPGPAYDLVLRIRTDAALLRPFDPALFARNTFYPGGLYNSHAVTDQTDVAAPHISDFVWDLFPRFVAGLQNRGLFGKRISGETTVYQWLYERRLVPQNVDWQASFLQVIARSGSRPMPAMLEQNLPGRMRAGADASHIVAPTLPLGTCGNRKVLKSRRTRRLLGAQPPPLCAIRRYDTLPLVAESIGIASRFKSVQANMSRRYPEPPQLVLLGPRHELTATTAAEARAVPDKAETFLFSHLVSFDDTSSGNALPLAPVPGPWGFYWTSMDLSWTSLYPVGPQ
jgi:hypothetical protein